VFGWCQGAFAEYACAAESSVLPKPANLTFEQSAAAGDSALTALQGKVQAGHRVLINGASGGVGTFAVQIAKSFGATVTAVCSTQDADMVRSIGADHVILISGTGTPRLRAGSAADGCPDRSPSTLSVSVSGGLGGHPGTDIPERTSRNGHRQGPLERDHGAEACARRGAHGGAVPLVSLDGGGSWNRDPQGSDGDVLAAARARVGVPRGGGDRDGLRELRIESAA
jgi:threonine dehydrogenase-like Zn-dependent dehydrogenase